MATATGRCCCLFLLYTINFCFSFSFHFYHWPFKSHYATNFHWNSKQSQRHFCWPSLWVVVIADICGKWFHNELFNFTGIYFLYWSLLHCYLMWPFNDINDTAQILFYCTSISHKHNTSILHSFIHFTIFAIFSTAFQEKLSFEAIKFLILFLKLCKVRFSHFLCPHLCVFLSI